MLTRKGDNAFLEGWGLADWLSSYRGTDFANEIHQTRQRNIVIVLTVSGVALKLKVDVYTRAGCPAAIQTSLAQHS